MSVNDEEFDQSIAKFRDEEAAVLHFQPNIERLLDSNFCRQIDAVIRRAGQKWERLQAVPGLADTLPTKRGVYMFVWRPAFKLHFDQPPSTEQCVWVLYVGKAGVEDGEHDTLRDRYKSGYSHYVGGDPSVLWDGTVPTTRPERLARYLTLRPLEYWYLLIEDVRDIPIIERKLIRLLAPPLNSHYGAKLKPVGKPQPAFEEPL